MPFTVIRNDITKMQVDAIVNSAHPEPAVGGGVDFAIHEAGGPELVQARIALGDIFVSDIKVTKGYNLPSKYVIHTVGPRWESTNKNKEDELYRCYYNSLLEANKLGCESVALPLISAGTYGFPRHLSMSICNDAVRVFLEDHEMMIYLVVFDQDSYIISNELYNTIEELIHSDAVVRQIEREVAYGARRRKQRLERPVRLRTQKVMHESVRFDPRDNDKSFRDKLFELIKERDLLDPEVYKKANLTRQHFSKIRSNTDYHPSKPTVLALAIALELDIDETEDLLSRAGYSLSWSLSFDRVVRMFIEDEVYDIFLINEALLEFDLETIGV